MLFTADALEQPFGQQMLRRMQDLGLNVTELDSNCLPSLKGRDERETYRLAKNTLAVVNAPPSQFKLQPIPPRRTGSFTSLRAARRTVSTATSQARCRVRPSPASTPTCPRFWPDSPLMSVPVR